MVVWVNGTAKTARAKLPDPPPKAHPETTADVASDSCALPNSDCPRLNLSSPIAQPEEIVQTPGSSVTPSNTESETPATPSETESPSGESPSPSPTQPDVEAPSSQTLIELDPKPNPLLLPTQPDEVQIRQTVPITLGQALELAERNNRQLQISRLQLERTQATLREALAALFPTLAVQGSATRDLSATGEIGVETQRRQLRDQISNLQTQIPNLQTQFDQATDPFDQFSSGLQLQQALTSLQTNQQQLRDLRNFATSALNGRIALNYTLFSPARKATIRAAREQIHFNQLQLEFAEEELRLNTTNAYYNLQQADEQVRIVEAEIRERRQSLEFAEALLEAGLATRLDVLNAQVELDDALQRLRNAQSNQQIQQRTLAEILSLPPAVTPVAADEVELAGEWNLSLEQTIILALENRAELEQQLVQRQINQAQRRIALAAVQPQVGLSANYDLVQAYSDDPSEFAGRGNADGYSLGITLNWTLYDGGAARARARQADIDVAIAEEQFAALSNQIRREVEQEFYQLQANAENVQTANTGLERAREALRAARLRFQAAVGTQTEVLDAETRLTRAEANLVNAIVGYNLALARLQRAVSNLANTDQ